MVSSTLLTLLVIPAIYGLIKGWRLPLVRRQQGDFITLMIIELAANDMEGSLPGKHLDSTN
jgi:hypothetical protein